MIKCKLFKKFACMLNPVCDVTIIMSNDCIDNVLIQIMNYTKNCDPDTLIYITYGNNQHIETTVSDLPIKLHRFQKNNIF